MLGKQLLERLRRRGQAAELPPELAESTRLLGQHCERLLADPVLRLCFELLEEDFTVGFKGTTLGDREGREAWYRMLAALQELDAKLRAMLGDARRLEAEQRIATAAAEGRSRGEAA